MFYCHFPDLLLAKHTTPLRRMYRKPIDFLEEQTTGMADMILVNSNFTASTFAKTFKRLHARGSRPAVLYPAVNVDQFIEPHAHKYCVYPSPKLQTLRGKKNIYPDSLPS